jgi:hypothetical protein
MATLTRSIVAPPPPDPVCRCCGHHGHQCDSCPHLYQSDANNTDSGWAESYLGRGWLRHGHSQYEANLVLPGYEERYSINTHGLVSLGSSSSSSSSSKHARFEGQAPRGDQRRKTPSIIISLVSLDVSPLHHWHWRQHPCFHLSLTITFSSRYYLFPVAQVVFSGVLVSKSHIGLERREIQLSNSGSITSHLGISMTLMKVPRGVDQVIWNGKTVGPKSEPGPMRNIPKGMGKKEGRILREVSRGKTRQ